MVLQVAPVGINHHQAIVPDVFEFGGHIVQHSGFPRPFTHSHPLHAGIAEIEAIVEYGKLAFLSGLLGIPLHRGTQHEVVRLVRSKGLAEFGLALASVAVVRSGQITHGAVACAVREQGCFQKNLLGGLYVADDDRIDLAAVFADGDRAVGGIEGDVGFGFYPTLLLAVFVVLCGLCIALFAMAEFPLHTAQGRIRAYFYSAAEVNPDLGAVVAAEHGTVVHEGHFQALTSRSHSSTHAGYSSSHHHKIIFRRCSGSVGQAKLLPAPGFHIRRRHIPVGCKIYGIATPLESG